MKNAHFDFFPERADADSAAAEEVAAAAAFRLRDDELDDDFRLEAAKYSTHDCGGEEANFEMC